MHKIKNNKPNTIGETLLLPIIIKCAKLCIVKNMSEVLKRIIPSDNTLFLRIETMSGEGTTADQD